MQTLLIVVALLLSIVYFWYASIISKRNKALEALSGIDIQLKQRSSLIPNILKIAKAMMDHEMQLMSEITKLREKVDSLCDSRDIEQVKEHLVDAETLDERMGQLMIRVEQYPDIKSDQTMIQAQQSYNEVEAQLAAARRFYNASVTELNNAVQIFPGNLIASGAGVKEMPFYGIDDAAKAPVNADDYLS